jgi:hypothetical protein
MESVNREPGSTGTPPAPERAKYQPPAVEWEEEFEPVMATSCNPLEPPYEC